MCTALLDTKCGNFFGRTLDLEYSLGEEVVICPRNFPFPLCHGGDPQRKYAIVGTACVRDGKPLYFDGVNEVGVAGAALNFPLSAKYADYRCHKTNLASFEIIPYILGGCESISEVREALLGVNITADAFSRAISPSPLHWIFSDRSGSLVVEVTAAGIKIHENPVGVLTNEPGFDFHLTRLADYAGLDAKTPKNTLSEDFKPTLYSRGLGAFGLPGDFSSVSRFVRAVFVKNHTSVEGADGVERFFRMMSTVSVPQGCVITDEGREVKTVYTSCMELDEPTYYFTTYGRSAVRAVSLRRGAPSSSELLRFSMSGGEQIVFLN